MTKHTAKALSAESGAPSERTETQGDLWKEIAEEGYDRTYTREELDRAFGMPFEEQYKKLTGKDLPATAKQETQGDLWKEIAEEGCDSLDGAWEKLAQRQETCETKSVIAPTAPIIEDGKTLDELIAPNDAIGQYLLRTMRADGATDQEIWQALVEN